MHEEHAPLHIIGNREKAEYAKKQSDESGNQGSRSMATRADIGKDAKKNENNAKGDSSFRHA
jgi:hypothetical protein